MILHSEADITTRTECTTFVAERSALPAGAHQVYQSCADGSWDWRRLDPIRIGTKMAVPAADMFIKFLIPAQREPV